MLINSQTITRTRLHFNKVIFYYYFKGENNEKVGKGKKLWQMRESFDRRESCQEAAEKGYQQGPKGLEKGKGRKPEGKGLVILLMTMNTHKYEDTVHIVFERMDAGFVMALCFT